jgi:DNA-binding GntR family transcriptional regulator
MPQLNSFDRRVLKLLFESDSLTQQKLATELRTSSGALAKSLSRLVAARLVVLKRQGQHQVPRLAIAAAFDELKHSFTALMEAA